MTTKDIISLAEADASLKLGMTQVRSGDFNSAVESFRRAAEADPEHSFAHNNLGSALAAIGRKEEAAEAFRRAIEIDPSYAQPYVNLGDALLGLGERDEAFACFSKALELDPQFGAAYFSLGRAQQASGKLNEALACYLQATDFSPNDGDVYTSLGTVLVLLRLGDAAIQAFEKALAIDPSLAVARAHLMHLLARDCDWDRLEAHIEWVQELGVIGDVVPPFTMLAFEDHPERHRVRSERFAITSFSLIKPLSVPARPVARRDRLRIGYFSADFREHATMFLSARMFELHDRSRFSIHAYSYGREDRGPMRNRTLKAFDEFKDVTALGDHAIASVARADGIDIAVDLKGYTEHQRVGVFAYRPAPIQITYLGYPGTLGAPFIDYLIADHVVVPGEQRRAYSEQLIYLPNSYQVNDDSREVPGTGGSRTEFGLPQEGFVFCCFNSTYKITPAEFDIWMDLLRRVDGSVLWLLASTANVERKLRSEAAKRRVEPDRIIFAQKVQPAAHLARQKFADLFLDTFNCNAHTTASDALWAGLPLLTKSGQGFAARVAASLLQAVGLDELITTNERDYAELALALARDPAKLAAIRAKLEVNRTTMPLFDSEKFTRHIEKAYDMAYDRFLKGEGPADIIVPQ